LTTRPSPKVTALEAPRAILTAAVHAYRLVLSPLMVSLFGPACRFEPSCSEYAHLAIHEHGIGRGSYLTVRRLLRCRPRGGHGYDPVPARHLARNINAS
jgi:uncharacterized protein